MKVNGRVLSLAPLALESEGLLTVLCGPAKLKMPYVTLLYSHISEAFLMPASSSGPSGLREIRSNLEIINTCTQDPKCLSPVVHRILSLTKLLIKDSLNLLIHI